MTECPHAYEKNGRIRCHIATGDLTGCEQDPNMCPRRMRLRVKERRGRTADVKREEQRLYESASEGLRNT